MENLKRKTKAQRFFSDVSDMKIGNLSYGTAHLKRQIDKSYRNYNNAIMQNTKYFNFAFAYGDLERLNHIRIKILLRYNSRFRAMSIRLCNPTIKTA